MYDDNRGVGEALNEENLEKKGIAVNAKYFVQIFDYTKTKSLQRQTQLLVDEPMQYFFALHYDTSSNSVFSQNQLITDMLEDFNGDLKIHTIPQERNKILIRLENIADLFDGTPSETPYFDLQTYARELYSHSNDGQMPHSVKIVERTLGNNQDYEDMEKSKFKWKSTDEASPVIWPVDNETGIALQPQRIRLFFVEYEATAEDFKILFLQK